MTVSRGFPNILSDNLAATKKWYVDLLGWVTEFDSDWFVHLKSPAADGVELGILAADHALIPSGANLAAGGTLLTFVVDDVDEMHERARGLGCAIVEAPTDQFYGQRRMVLADPMGTLVDISSECPPSADFLATI